jgi:hypothetical protein
MANLKVALLLRVKTTIQQRSYLKSAVAANGKIRPLWAVCNNQPTHFPDGVYYLRHKQSKRLAFERDGENTTYSCRRIPKEPGLRKASKRVGILE